MLFSSNSIADKKWLHVPSRNWFGVPWSNRLGSSLTILYWIQISWARKLAFLGFPWQMRWWAGIPWDIQYPSWRKLSQRYDEVLVYLEVGSFLISSHADILARKIWLGLFRVISSFTHIKSKNYSKNAKNIMLWIWLHVFHYIVYKLLSQNNYLLPRFFWPIMKGTIFKYKVKKLKVV